MRHATCQNADCGKTFETKIPHQKYCSDPCRFAAWNAQNRNALRDYFYPPILTAIQKSGLDLQAIRHEVNVEVGKMFGVNPGSLAAFRQKAAKNGEPS